MWDRYANFLHNMGRDLGMLAANIPSMAATHCSLLGDKKIIIVETVTTGLSPK